MEIRLVTQLSALAHPQRLSMFRLLVRRFPSQVPAGEIGAALGLKASTTSAYLAALREAGLIRDRRDRQRILYSVDMDAVQALTDGLIGECCGGRAVPALCDQPAADLNRRFRVLFICTGNSARSIFAEAILRHFAGDRFDVYSAGLHPAGAVKPQVLSVLEGNGIATEGLTSKALGAVWEEEMDFVFTVCDRAANEECPTVPGHPISAHWSIPDPSACGGNAAERVLAYQRAFTDLYNRIKGFSNLPFDALDRRSLQNAVTEIARMESPAS